jgi:hypothetical protein
MRKSNPTALLASGMALLALGLGGRSALAEQAGLPIDTNAAVLAADPAGVPSPTADRNAAVAPAPPVAAADGAATRPAPPPAPKRFPRLKQPSLVHLDQFGLAVLPGSGYRIIAPYQDMVPCGQQNKRVCTGWLPFFIDVQPSFGLGRHWDALVDLRFGVVADFSQSHQFAVAPGFRYWVDPDLDTKFFTTLQGVYDVNPQHDPGTKDYDFGVRNANGFMFEVMRNLGFYLQFGETMGFVRWLRFEVDGGIGVQARFP